LLFDYKNALHKGIRGPKIRQVDTLSKGFTEWEKYSVVLANPPFKGSIDESDINDRLTLGTKKTELLFCGEDDAASSKRRQVRRDCARRCALRKLQGP
jgi:23S rRNA A1618 N6-methylase RlmF